jgi:hypothetical protein
MTESNTGSDLGPNTPKSPGHFKSFKHGEKRVMGPSETPRERMVRVVQEVQKKRKKR